MKLGINNRRWLGCRLFATTIISLLALAVGCEKSYELDLPLAVTARTLKLTKEAGKTNILIYASGRWTATLTEDADWASINKLSGDGNADILFSYAANYGIARKVGVVFMSGDLRDTVMLTQEASVTAPALNFTDRTATLLGAPSEVRIPLTTNVPYNIDKVKVEVTYAENAPSALPASQVRSDEQGWISDTHVTSKALTFKAAKYTGEEPRVATVTLRLVDANANEVVSMLTVTQTNESPKLVFASAAESYPGFASDQVVAAQTNLLSYARDLTITTIYDEPVAEEELWVRGIALTQEGLKFSLQVNEVAGRTATIKLAYTDSEGNAVEATHRITQKIYPKLLTFPELRAKISGASGEFTIPTENAIEGFVVSEPGGANTCLNPQAAQFGFRTDESLVTAYIQSTDGKYGFCVKFASKADNTLLRYSKVRISLKDLVLVKESDPTRYTIKGVAAANVIEASEPALAQMPAKNKSLSQLTDDDIYTLVALQNMEIVFKDGAYTNHTEGYVEKSDWNPDGSNVGQGRSDCTPLLMADNAGKTISMLTNMNVTWRRDGTGVPQGSGIFSGVIVAEKLIRYGDLGRYQVRAMVKSDIAMGATPRSKTIVEWNWNNLTADLIPEVGTGTLLPYFDAASTAEKISSGQDYNSKTANNLSGTTKLKGCLNNSGVYLNRNWWNWATNEGHYFDVKFSTAGLTGTSLGVGFTWNHGAGSNTTIDAPAHWKMLVSTDGVTFTEIVPLITSRSIVWWSNTLQDNCPGFRDHFHALPTSCFGKEEVTVRLQVADKVTDVGTAGAYPNDLGAEKGTLTSKVTAIRLGALTVRYN